MTAAELKENVDKFVDLMAEGARLDPDQVEPYKAFLLRECSEPPEQPRVDLRALARRMATSTRRLVGYGVVRFEPEGGAIREDIPVLVVPYTGKWEPADSVEAAFIQAVTPTTVAAETAAPDSHTYDI